MAEKLSEGTIEEAIELAYWKVDSRVKGGSTIGPHTERDAFKVTVRELISERRLIERAAVPMLLWCPECSERHIDEGDFATKEHHTHACQHCGHVWRPAIGPTCGVRFLPGFKNEEPSR